MMEDMYAVMSRIQEIKKRFGLVQPNAAPRDAAAFDNEVNAQIRDAAEKEKAAGFAERADLPSRENFSISDIKDLAHRNAAKRGVPPGLIDAIIKNESSYNARAVSSKGAMGLMQLMPSVARSLGVEDPFSPEENIDAGVGIVKHLLEKYSGDYKKALAAYNAGEGAVDRNDGIPSITETREYVQKVIRDYMKNSE